MKVKLTKEEFIKRSMNGDVFEYDGCRYFYDVTKTIPFRFNEVDLLGNWGKINGETEFTFVESKSKTKIVKEWMYNITGDKNPWFIIDTLMTIDEAKKLFMEIVHKPTGREFEVPDE